MADEDGNERGSPGSGGAAQRGKKSGRRGRHRPWPTWLAREAATSAGNAHPSAGGRVHDRPGSRLRAAEPLHEPLFYLERLEARRPLAFRLRSGEDIVGTVAWYDRDAVRVDGADGSHLILLKHAIKHVADAG